MPSTIRKKTLKSGAVRWEVNVEGIDPATGAPKRVYRSFDTKREARAFVENRRAATRRGDVVDPSAEPLREFLTFWLDTVAEGRVRPNTLAGYRYVAGKYVYPFVGGLPLKDVDLGVIAAWQATLRDAGLSKRTRQLALGVTRQALDFAVLDRRIPYNPAASYRFGKREQAVGEARATDRKSGAVAIPQRDRTADVHRAAREAMPPEAARAFLAAAAGNQHEVLFNVLLILGLRPSEALALRWKDLKGGRLHVSRSVACLAGARFEFQPTKTGQEREVPVPEGLGRMLAAHKAMVGKMRLAAGPLWQNLGLMFPHPEGKPIRWDVIRRCHWYPLMKKAGLGETVVNPKTGKSRFLPAFAPYSTRHTAVSNMARAGVNVKVAAAVVGHSDTATTLKWYTHSASDLEAAAVDAGAALLQGEPVEKPKEGGKRRRRSDS